MTDTTQTTPRWTFWYKSDVVPSEAPMRTAPKDAYTDALERAKAELAATEPEVLQSRRLAKLLGLQQRLSNGLDM